MATKKIPAAKEKKTRKTQSQSKQSKDKDKESKKQSEPGTRTRRTNSYTRGPTGLSEKELKFVEAYLEHGNGTRASKEAGYGYKSDKVHGVNASKLLAKAIIREYIDDHNAQLRKSTIATAQEVMEYFTRVMNGEINDQFGLEAPLSERTKAAQELAKRTVDWEARKAGQPDATLSIKLDFSGL